jgi:hypothetical protein
MDHGRVACACVLVVLSLAGGWPAGAAAAGSATSPTPTDFIGLPECMLYAHGSDLRVRVRAHHAAAVCRTLTRKLARWASGWSLRAEPLRHILSPICLIADPNGRVELQVIDDAHNGARGARICAALAASGWLNLGR